MRKGTRFAVITAAAAGLGYIAGILTAPKSGKETRKDIKDKAVQTKEDLVKKLTELSGELGEVIAKGKSRAKSLETAARAELEKAVNAAVLTKDKAKDILTSVKKGEAEDKDLQNAIKDVHDAVDNLKKYLKKHG